MNNTSYRSRAVRSPFQPQHPVQILKEKAMDTQVAEHPIRKEVRSLCQTYNLTATFSEDTGTLSTLKTPGLIAVKCLLAKDNIPVGVGHGTAIITRLNKGIERTIFICLNAAFLSAANSACKVLDSLRLEEHDSTPPKSWKGQYEPKEEEESSDIATEKQKAYLLQLISLNVSDEGEREQFASTLDDMTRGEASEAIKRFVR